MVAWPTERDREPKPGVLNGANMKTGYIFLVAALLVLGTSTIASAQTTQAERRMVGIPQQDSPADCDCMAGTPDTDPPEPDPATWGAFAPVAQPGADFDLEVPPHSDPSGPIQYRWRVYIGGTPQGATSWSTSTTATYDGFGEGVPYCFRPEARDVFGNTTQLGEEKCEIAFP